jgi:DNA-binding GntR family transcriptional regulator
MQIESLVDLAKRHIQLWIIKSEYKPGQKLKEEEISIRLGISRPPIREAFKALESEGLVIRKPRRGVFVTEMTEKDVWEAYTLKATLYEMATELAIEFISEDQLKELELIVRTMEDCVKSNPLDLLCYQEYHQEFHDKILLISGNDRLKKFSASIHLQVCRFSYKSLQNRDHLYSSLHYHREIMNAIKEKKKSLACKLMKRHVLDALDVLREMNNLNEEIFDDVPLEALASD